MNQKHYESVIIINAALEDPQIEQIISSVKQNIINLGGEITGFEDWGRKRLAYSINNAKSGYYLINRFTAPTTIISEFERTLRLDENVIRYLTIALDKKALENIEKQAQLKDSESIDEDAIESEVLLNEESKD